MLEFLAEHCSDSGREAWEGGLAVQLACGVGARERGLMSVNAPML